MAAPKKSAPPWTAKKDDKADKRAGIKEGSPRDKKLDAKRGVPEKPPMKKAPAKKK